MASMNSQIDPHLKVSLDPSVVCATELSYFVELFFCPLQQKAS